MNLNKIKLAIVTSALSLTIASCTNESSSSQMYSNNYWKYSENTKKALKKVDRITDLITAGKQEFPTVQKNLLFIGPTGVGKSSTINLLLGNTLDCKKIYGSRSLTIDRYAEGPKIGNDRINSETDKVRIWPTKDLWADYSLCDCPGFFDTRGLDQEIKNAVEINDIVRCSKHVAFILVLSLESMTGAKGGKLVDFLVKLSKVSADVSFCSKWLNFFITGVDEDTTEQDIRFELKSYIPNLEQIIKENLRTYELRGSQLNQECKKIKDLYGASCENKIFIFPKVKIGKKIQYTKSQRIEVMDSVNYMYNPRYRQTAINFLPVLSDKSIIEKIYPMINELLGCIRDVEKIQSSLRYEENKLNNKKNEINSMSLRGDDYAGIGLLGFGVGALFGPLGWGAFAIASSIGVMGASGIAKSDLESKKTDLLESVNEELSEVLYKKRNCETEVKDINSHVDVLRHILNGEYGRHVSVDNLMFIMSALILGSCIIQ